MAQSEMKKQTKQVGKIKKKTWVKIFSPKDIGNIEIGETYVEDPHLCIGRTVKVNLMQLTGDVKSQIFDVKFEIIKFSDNKLETKIIGYYVSLSAIKRLIRRNMTRIDDSIVALTKDEQKVRIKPFLLTRNKVSKSVEYSLRITLREEIIKSINKIDYNQLFSMIVKYQFQKEIRDKLNKIYPIKNLEIRVLEEEKNKNIKLTDMPIKKVIKAKLKKKEDILEESEIKEIKEDEKETKSETTEDKMTDKIVEQKK